MVTIGAVQQGCSNDRSRTSTSPVMSFICLLSFTYSWCQLTICQLFCLDVCPSFASTWQLRTYVRLSVVFIKSFSFLTQLNRTQNPLNYVISGLCVLTTILISRIIVLTRSFNSWKCIEYPNWTVFLQSPLALGKPGYLACPVFLLDLIALSFFLLPWDLAGVV